MKTTVKSNLILRIVALGFSLISLVLMVISSTNYKSSLSLEDYSTSFEYHFNNYKPFRYVIVANELSCVYYTIRIIQILAGLSGGYCYYLSFIFDQVMTYIILSSASSGIGCIMLTKEIFRAGEIYDNNVKKFLLYASASVSMQLMGFVVIAACAVMSAYSLSCYLYTTILCNIADQEIRAHNIDIK
ncbi:hypothetical protein SUGI_0309010 [Cryptomeria japonica]|uniref:CASP-like protein 4A4 n=1 Tax=Cryptomeria japonica TaxID=3369 RepID=UPI002408D3EA|nr:CASP-like protein 4A4 [Cryptomeria japonica]GLJ17708.1 hypothetical protein SUGI_0309010 [Cryptomeria japonica]